MSEFCKTSLQYIDGKPVPNFYNMKENEFEECLWVDYGYDIAPNDDVTSITKDDLINHPEKFRPFEYSKFLYFIDTYDNLINNIIYDNGEFKYNKSYIIREKIGSPHVSLMTEIIYLKQYYPWLYKELLGRNALLESPEQDNGEHTNTPNENTKSIITPDEVNEDEMPEEITYIKKKMKGGVVYVPKTEKSVKAKDNKPKQETKERVEINYTYIPESSDLKL